MAQTQFSLEYILSLFLAMLSAYLIEDNVPGTMNIIKFFVVPFLVAYVSLMLFNTLLPKINLYGDKISAYADTRVLGEINSSGYFQIFPPVFAVFIIFVILIYNRSL